MSQWEGAVNLAASLLFCPPARISAVPQEKRVLEYVALGDFQTAVGFLLASPPDRTTRYYRDALCTLGMAFACGLQHSGLLLTTTGSGGAAPGSQAGAQPAASAPAGGAEDSAARSLFVQAAKVITANAAAVGDTLLGVPLLCSTGKQWCVCVWGGGGGGWIVG
jgi:hypothetical protein